MKKYIYLSFAALTLASCNDFLEREPLDFASAEAYYKTENDLKIAVNDFYEILPQNNSNKNIGNAQNNGLYVDDILSDNQCGPNAMELLYKGDKRTVQANESEWDFSSLRGINFFIQKWFENEGKMTGSQEFLNHYLGEAYFFRAWDHFRLLRNFGDAPILTKVLTDNISELREASKRHPRNEVARFIIDDLDKAADLMLETVPEKGRVTKSAAYALKSRVALYEGTWEKYHANTCFVPGNSKWVGKDMWPDFSWPAGSAEAEYRWFLQQCVDASEKAVANHPLNKEDYMSMFNSVDLSGMREVILARYYLPGILAHNCSYYLRSGGGCGVTRQAVNTYLMQNGLPIYAANSGYQGDVNSYVEFLNRDPRLAGNRNADGTYPRNPSPIAGNANFNYTGYGIIRPAGFIKNGNDTTFYYKPDIDQSGQQKATTGYALHKWVNSDDEQRIQYQCYTSVPLLRSAECMLNYIEAYYELNGNLGGNCDTYWREIRSRAGVDTDYQKTIAATDLAQENDFGVWSRSVEVSPTLYNIRRERRCELIAEGRRMDDLKRWRAFDKMVDWQPEGINLWTEVYEMYLTGAATTIGGVSPRSVSDYIRPLQSSVSSRAYEGYTFPKPHYLEPIPISEFTLTLDPSTGKSTIYQNPGWPANSDGPADYSYDCD